MDKDKFQCDFATMSKRLDFAEDVYATGSKIHYISCYAEENKEQFSKEINSILDEGYDIVHLYTKQWKSFLIEEICRERRISRVIVHSQSSRCDANDDAKREEETRNHYRVREMFNENLATDYWACSMEAADWLFGEQIGRDKIKIMPNAIEVDKFLYQNELRTQLRREYGVEDKFVIGNVGRLVYQKNQELLLDAFAEAHKVRTDLVLFLIGDGERREEFEQKAKQLGLEKDVVFLGKRNDHQIFYQMMDLFAMPSRFEGVSIAMIEAQTAGLPCIAGDTLTAESDITGNVTFLPLEPKAWTDELVRAQKRPERGNMLPVIENAGYDLKSQVKKIESEYIFK